MCIHIYIRNYIHIWSPSTTTLSTPLFVFFQKKGLIHLIQVAITLLRLLLITSFEGGWWLLTLDLDQSVWIIRALRGGWCHHTRIVDLSCRCRKKCVETNWLGFEMGFWDSVLEGQVWTDESWTTGFEPGITGPKDVAFPCLWMRIQTWFTDLRNTWLEVDAVISHLRCWLLGFA